MPCFPWGTLLAALDTIARLGLGDDRVTIWDVPWRQLGFPHTRALRSALAEEYAHTAANRMLSALKDVLKAAWKLGLMTAEEYQKAASVESIRGETVPAGRALNTGELVAGRHGRWALALLHGPTPYNPLCPPSTTVCLIGKLSGYGFAKPIENRARPPNHR